MIRGVSLNISSRKPDRILYDILNCINVSDYVWYNVRSQSETWDVSYEKEFLLENKYDGASFKEFR